MPFKTRPRQKFVPRAGGSAKDGATPGDIGIEWPHPKFTVPLFPGAKAGDPFGFRIGAVMAGVAQFLKGIDIASGVRVLRQHLILHQQQPACF